METKDFFQSKQTWGAIVYLLAPFLSSLGIEIDQQAVVDAILQIIGAGLFLWGAFSRNRKPVGSVAGIPVQGGGA